MPVAYINKWNIGTQFVIVNNINNRINPTIILSNNRVSSAQLPSVKPDNTNSDSLQKQMSFMGLTNTPIIKSHSNSAKSAGLKLLDKYLTNLRHIDIGENMTVLVTKNNIGFDTIIVLLKNPMKFDESLDKLGLNMRYLNTDFKDFKKAIQKTPQLKNTSILGIVGQGASSTAFLTKSGTVIKLSTNPNFPSPKEFVKDLEVPILKRYIIDLQYGQKVYGVEEMFTEDATLRGISIEEYNEIFDKFSDTLKKANPDYSFKDFYKSLNSIFFSQIGFIEDTPYLIDHECISGRKLMK